MPATQPHIAVGGLLTDRDGHLVACRMGEREEAAGWNGVEQCGDDTARIVGVGDAVQDRDEHDPGRPGEVERAWLSTMGSLSTYTALAPGAIDWATSWFSRA